LSSADLIFNMPLMPPKKTSKSLGPRGVRGRTVIQNVPQEEEQEEEHGEKEQEEEHGENGDSGVDQERERGDNDEGVEDEAPVEKGKGKKTKTRRNSARCAGL
jgi:hypothetical protein